MGHKTCSIVSGTFVMVHVIYSWSNHYHQDVSHAALCSGAADAQGETLQSERRRTQRSNMGLAEVWFDQELRNSMSTKIVEIVKVAKLL